MNRQIFFSALGALTIALGRQSAVRAAETFAPAPSAAPPAVPFVPPAPPPVPLAQPEGGSMLPNLPNLDLTWSGYFEALAILCFVLALVLAVLWLVKKRGSSGFFSSSAPAMRLESRLALGPKKWLIVVRCQDRRLVLGVTEKSINLLTELYDQDFAVEGRETDAQDGSRLLLAKLSPPGKSRGKDKNGQQDAQNEADEGLSLSFASMLRDGSRGRIS